jgi:hypothetical protein
MRSRPHRTASRKRMKFGSCIDRLIPRTLDLLLELRLAIGSLNASTSSPPHVGSTLRTTATKAPAPRYADPPTAAPDTRGRQGSCRQASDSDRWQAPDRPQGGNRRQGPDRKGSRLVRIACAAGGRVDLRLPALSSGTERLAPCPSSDEGASPTDRSRGRYAKHVALIAASRGDGWG